MPGANVIATLNGKPRELNQGGTSTSITNFTTDGTVLVGVPITISRICTGSGATGNTKPVRIRAWGRVACPTTSNYTASLLFGSSSSSTAVIEASTAVSVANAGTWQIQSDVMIDVANNRTFGMGQSQVMGTVATLATFDNGITPDFSTASGIQYYFFVAGTFGTGTATNVSYLDGFELSTID